MADNDQILNALKQLDPSNDAHWTQAKEPAMDTIKSLTHDQTISREDVNVIAEGFNRDTAAGYFMAQTAKPWETGESTPAAGQDGEVLQASTDPSAVVPEDSEGQIPDEQREGEPPMDVTGQPDQNVGQDANGDAAGSVVVEPEAPSLGENAEGDPSGVPSGKEERTTADAPEQPGSPANPVATPQVETPGDVSGPANASELTTSPRAEGAEADDGAASSGAGGPNADDGEAEQPKVEEPRAGADEIEALEAELEEKRNNLDELRLNLDSAKKAFTDAQQEVDDLAGRLEAIRPAPSSSDVVQQYLASQRRLNEERGARRHALSGVGIDLKELAKAVGKAPIDQAMARKTSRGGKRPSHPRS